MGVFPNDYFVRQIEMLVWGIARIMGLRQENKVEACEGLYQDTLRKFFGLSDRAVEELPWRSLMAVASLGGTLDAERSALLAQLIREKAGIITLQGGEAGALYAKALCIYLEAWNADETLQIPEHEGRIDELATLVADGPMPEDGLDALIRFYEQTGRFDALDALRLRLGRNDKP